MLSSPPHQYPQATVSTIKTPVWNRVRTAEEGVLESEVLNCSKQLFESSIWDSLFFER
jgi:hypothetical protein